MTKCIVLCLCIIICAPPSESLKILKKIKDFLHPTTTTTPSTPVVPFVQEYDKDSDENDSDEARITTSTKSSRDSSEEFFSAEDGETHANKNHFTTISPSHTASLYPEISTTEKTFSANEDYSNLHDNRSTSVGPESEETKSNTAPKYGDSHKSHVQQLPETTNDFGGQTSTVRTTDSYNCQPVYSYVDFQTSRGGGTHQTKETTNEDGVNQIVQGGSSSATQPSNSKHVYSQIQRKTKSSGTALYGSSEPTKAESSCNQIQPNRPIGDVGHDERHTQGVKSPVQDQTLPCSNQLSGSTIPENSSSNDQRIECQPVYSHTDFQPRPSASREDQNMQNTSINYEDNANQNQNEPGGSNNNYTNTYTHTTTNKDDEYLNQSQTNQQSSYNNSFNYETSSTTRPSNSINAYNQTKLNDESSGSSLNGTSEPTDTDSSYNQMQPNPPIGGAVENGDGDTQTRPSNSINAFNQTKPNNETSDSPLIGSSEQPTNNESSYNQIQPNPPRGGAVENGERDTQGLSFPENHTPFSNQNPGSTTTTVPGNVDDDHLIFPDNPALNATEEPLRKFERPPKKHHQHGQFTTERSQATGEADTRNMIDGPEKDCGPGMKPDAEGKCRKIARK